MVSLWSGEFRPGRTSTLVLYPPRSVEAPLVPLASLQPQLWPLLLPQLFSSLQLPQLRRQDSYPPPPLLLDECCDNTHSTSTALLFAAAARRIARAYLIQNPC